MLRLYENAFSPFARKVRMVLEHKGLGFEATDGLSRANRAALEAVNGRVEVPVLVHDGIVVINSADIVAYVERAFPEHPVYPADAGTWVRARAWERCADTVVDPILVDVSYWLWAQRHDVMPDGLLESARADLGRVYDVLEGDLARDDRAFVCGALSIADFALFPHLTAVRALNVSFDPERCPRLHAWLKRMRGIETFARDLERTRRYLAQGAALDVERIKIFWRGDRLEWLLAKGHHEWLMREIEAGRVLWPGLGIPGPAPAPTA
jgi:glutathione S-transferase